jgi:hypothetical protein
VTICHSCFQSPSRLWPLVPSTERSPKSMTWETWSCLMQPMNHFMNLF